MAEGGVEEALAEQHAIGHVFDDGFGGGAVFESDGVADFLTKADTHFLRNSLSHRHSSDSPRLRAGHFHAPPAHAHLTQVLWHLRSLATTRLPDHYQNAVLRNRLHQLIFQLEDGEGLFLLGYGHGRAESGIHAGLAHGEGVFRVEGVALAGQGHLEFGAGVEAAAGATDAYALLLVHVTDDLDHVPGGGVGGGVVSDLVEVLVGQPGQLIHLLLIADVFPLTCLLHLHHSCSL